MLLAPDSPKLEVRTTSRTWAQHGHASPLVGGSAYDFWGPVVLGVRV